MSNGVGFETEDRILDAAYALASRIGIKKMTFEDIAAKASLSRQTLYRYFENKDALLRALFEREAEHFFVALERGVQADVPLEEALSGSLTFTLDYLHTHPVLSWVYENEPDQMVPHLTVYWRPILAAAHRFLEPHVASGVKAGMIPKEMAEIADDWITRVVVSFLVAPSTVVDMQDDDSVKRWVPALILYGLAGRR
jgi:AcrR family transcriptional regulator